MDLAGELASACIACRGVFQYFIYERNVLPFFLLFMNFFSFLTNSFNYAFTML